jgi:hypothetical protein
MSEQTREARLEKALKEIKEFAERNFKRAQEAHKSSLTAPVGSAQSVIDKISNEGRLHEAARIKEVIVFRVMEALS